LEGVLAHALMFEFEVGAQEMDVMGDPALVVVGGFEDVWKVFRGGHFWLVGLLAGKPKK
jgi:hypothetical protein